MGSLPEHRSLAFFILSLSPCSTAPGAAGGCVLSTFLLFGTSDGCHLGLQVEFEVNWYRF